MALLENCTELGNCGVVSPASCTPTLNAALNPVGLTISDYLCNCQDERLIWTKESPTRKRRYSFLRKLFFGNMSMDEDLFGKNKNMFTLKDVGELPSKGIRSQSGKSVEFLVYKGHDFHTNVTLDSTGTLLTVTDSSIFKPCMSVEIVTQGADDCCYEKFIRNVISTPSATTVELDSAVTVVEGSRVIARFDEVKKCGTLCDYDFDRKADKFESFYQIIGRKLCFDVNDLNACAFTDFNQTITEALYGMKLKSQYEKKMNELMDWFEHQILMAVNTGMNREMTTLQGGETLGIETAMAYARNTLGITNEYKIQAMSPRAIFQNLLELVIDHQRELSGSGDYIVGVTRKLYSWIKTNQEFLRIHGDVKCCNSDGVYRIGNVEIDTGYGKVEFMIDPYIDMAYAEKMIGRFLPNETSKFFTQQYSSIDLNGSLISYPTGLQKKDISHLNDDKIECGICHMFSYKFAFVPGGALNGDIFKVEIVNA